MANRLCDTVLRCEPDPDDPIIGFSSRDINSAAPPTSGIVFGDPGTGVAFGNPDTQVAFGIPLPPCIGVTCPGDINEPFGNFSSECPDADYLGEKVICNQPGDPVNLQFRAPGIGPFTWRWESSDPFFPFDFHQQTVPFGLSVSIDDCGVLTLSGKIGAVGSYVIILIAEDGFGNLSVGVIRMFTIILLNPVIPFNALVQQGEIQLVGGGGSGHYFFYQISGTLPPGYSFSPDGLISGPIEFPVSPEPPPLVFGIVDAECFTLTNPGPIPLPPPIQCPVTAYPLANPCMPGTITLVCCDGSQVTGTITPGMNAAEVQQVLLNMYLAYLRALQNCGPAPPLFYLAANTDQSCTSNCPDGNPFTFTVPSGRFFAGTQQKANDAAFKYACDQAKSQKICLSDIPDGACLGDAYSQIITATGGSLAEPPLFNYWTADGNIPPGLTFNGGFIQGNAASITGTPTTVGSYDFTITLTAPNGDTMTKPYNICVIEQTVTPAGSDSSHLPNGTLGAAYSATLKANSCAATPLSWQLAVPGSLPTGLSLDESTGVISGTIDPAEDPGDYLVTIFLQTKAS